MADDVTAASANYQLALSGQVHQHACTVRSLWCDSSVDGCLYNYVPLLAARFVEGRQQCHQQQPLSSFSASSVPGAIASSASPATHWFVDADRLPLSFHTYLTCLPLQPTFSGHSVVS